MATTKRTASTIPEIESAIKSFFGDMVKIEFLENCLKQAGLANDVKRYCHLKLSDLYAYKLMYSGAAKNMDLAAECATSPKDRINFYLKEISLIVKSGDYFLLDKPFKKSMQSASNSEKEVIKNHVKLELMNHAENFEKRNKRTNAAQVYERLMNLPVISETEKRMIIEKVGKLYSSTGKIKEAVMYEQMAKKPVEVKRNLDEDGKEVKRVSWNDLGIEAY